MNLNSTAKIAQITEVGRKCFDRDYAQKAQDRPHFCPQMGPIYQMGGWADYETVRPGDCETLRPDDEGID
jgi:hypothetical protein